MRTIRPFVICALLSAAYTFAQAQTELSVPGALQASNRMNPNVSVIGWLQGETGRRAPNFAGADTAAFQFKEAELTFQSVVDPYGKADIFIGLHGEGGIELEEGVLEWFRMPFDLALKAGKFRPDIGRFNRIHPPETAFADRPLVHEQFFGEEGLSSPGAGLSWQIPNPWLFLDLSAQAVNIPEAAEVPAFDKARKGDILYVSRLSGYYDLTDAANVALGGSFAHGAAGQEFMAVTNSSRTLRSDMGGLDLLLRWKNPRRAVYRSALWQTEVFWSKRDAVSDSSLGSWGMFTHLEYQFARRWRAGARYDYAQVPTDGSLHEAGGLAYLTFTPSEYSRISIQGRRARRTDGVKETLGWLKVTFNIGPHGAHPF
ncbi:MAG: hypothetical protein ABIJ96_10005 [Elusimicrobiota bacterium]